MSLPLPLLLSVLPFFLHICSTSAALIRFFHLSCLLSLPEVSAVDRRPRRRIRPGSIHHVKVERWGGGVGSFALKQERVWQFDMLFVNNQLRLSSGLQRFFCFFEVVVCFWQVMQTPSCFFDGEHSFPLAVLAVFT